jgi:uncharacterized membrane protein YphA (DoxX/SURF4 family)
VTAVAAPRERSPWDRFLFDPESPSPMALVRIAWGFLATVWAISLIPDVDPFLTEGALRYHRGSISTYWNPLRWTDWHGAPMAACVVLLVAGIFTCVGLKTRLSSLVAAVAMLSLQRTNPLVFNSGDLVLRQIGIFVALAPAGLVLSLDARLARGRQPDLASDPPRRAPWPVRLLQLDIALGYALTAWAKLRGSSWHDGTALTRALRIEDLRRVAVPDWLLRQDVLLNAATWGTLAFEGAFVFLVWRRRWRPWILLTGVAFHIAIDLAFDVGFFSYAMFAAYLAFLPPEVADRVVAAIRGRLPQRLR